MKKLFSILFLIVFISGCEQMSRDRNYAGREKNSTFPIVNKHDAGIPSQDEKKQDAITEPEDFETGKGQNAIRKTGRERDNANKDAKEILNEIEKIICEGDCSRYAMPKPDISKLEDDIKMALRDGGVNGVAVDVNNQAEITLKGAVGCEEEKNKAFRIAEGFNKGDKRLKDMIFVVQTEEGKL